MVISLVVVEHRSNDSPFAINARPTWYKGTGSGDLPCNTWPSPRPYNKPKQPAIRVITDSADVFLPTGPIIMIRIIRVYTTKK